jgi:hypothetical protein
LGWTKQVDGNVTRFLAPTPGAGVEFAPSVREIVKNVEDEKAVVKAIGGSIQNAKLSRKDIWAPSGIGPLFARVSDGGGASSNLGGWSAMGMGQKDGKPIEFLTWGVHDDPGSPPPGMVCHYFVVTASYPPGSAASLKDQMAHVLESIRSSLGGW